MRLQAYSHAARRTGRLAFVVLSVPGVLLMVAPRPVYWRTAAPLPLQYTALAPGLILAYALARFGAIQIALLTSRRHRVAFARK